MSTEDPDDPVAGLVLRTLPDPSGLLQAIVASAPMAIQIFRADGRCVLVNQAHTALFGGVPPPEFNLLEDTILLDLGLMPLIRRAFAGERVSLPPFWYDPRQLRNVEATEGRRFAIRAQGVPLRGASGDVEHVLWVFEDVTAALEARAEAEAAVRAAEEARIAAEASAASSAFLAETSRLLADSLDHETTLARIAQLATPTLADFCIVDLVDGDGTIRRVAAVHADPAAQPTLDELCSRFPPRPGSLLPADRVIASGRPELMPDVDLRIVTQHAYSAEHVALVEKLGLRSHLAVPLQLGERTVGAISLGYVGERRYRQADVPLVEALASRAAVAIENARLYELAEASRAEAEAASRAKDELLAMLGHELRNPLAPIVTALELLEGREGPSRERDVIERQVGHLGRLVDDLLDVARFTLGKLELDRQPVELSAAVHDGLELARPLLEERGHRLVVEVPPAGLVVLADPFRLAQIVANLLTNAARYTPPGGVVTVSGERRGAEVALRVRDTGLGLAHDLLPRVFDVFVQGPRSADRAEGGLGLGLAIVRSLSELHGGRATARSDGPGLGSEFEVTLPAHEGPVAAPAAQSPARPAEVRRRVLLVDDNVEAADLLAEALTSVGYEVRVCYHPLRALAALEGVGEAIGATTPPGQGGRSFGAPAAEPCRAGGKGSEEAGSALPPGSGADGTAFVPDLALIDIGLPFMDGYELARWLRDVPGLAELPIVAITGYGQPVDRERSRAAGFAEHLVKPVKLRDLHVVLDRVLGQRSAVSGQRSARKQGDG